MIRALSLGLLVCALSCLAACGFTPLYAADGVNSGLAQIQVNVPHGRTAFLLGEELDDAFVHNRETRPLYRLDVTLSERTFSRGLNIANSAKYLEAQVTAHYRLIDLASGAVLKTGDQPVEVSYAAADQPYPAVTAQQDAEKRAAGEAAQRIRIDIASYFAAKAAP